MDISGNIPGGPVNVIREDPKKKDVLYVGTDLGVYVTVEGGKNWHVLDNGIPICFVWDLIIHPRDNTLVIATNGLNLQPACSGWFGQDVDMTISVYRAKAQYLVIVSDNVKLIAWD